MKNNSRQLIIAAAMAIGLIAPLAAMGPDHGV
jgi:hypothetical protein